MMFDKTIVGAMLVSQNAEVLDYSIPNLLKWCSWVLIVMDNETDEVREKVYKFQKQYYNKLFVRRSSIPNKLFSRNGKELTYHERWKSVKGVIRNDVFVNLRNILDWKKPGYDKIDILLWPDHDVIFTDHLPELLKEFIDSDKKAISMRHIDVINNLRTIAKSDIGCHVHVVKYSSELAGVPRRFFALYYPLCESDVMRVEGYSVHLAYLTEKGRRWRRENWKTDNVDSHKLINLNRSVVELSPKEIYERLSIDNQAVL